MNQLKEAIYYGRELFLAGVNNGANGNLSFKKKGQVLITRSGSVMSELTRVDFVKTTSANSSSETPAHQIIYDNNCKINAILHIHSSSAITLSLKTKKKNIVPVDLEGKYHFPTIPIITTKLIPGAPDLPAKLLKNHSTGAVIVRGHGVFVFGESIRECYLKALTVDNICGILR